MAGKVTEFQALSEDERTALKWNFLLERFKVHFQVGGNRRLSRIVIFLTGYMFLFE